MQILLLHGLGQDPSSWQAVKSWLPEEISTACPNLFGLLHGQTPTYPNLYASFTQYCSTLPEPLHLCGLSLGGILALHYSIHHLERVGSVVLIGAQYKMPKTLLTLQNGVFRLLPETVFQQMGLPKKEMIQLTRSMVHLDFTRYLHSLQVPALILCGEKDRSNQKASKELAEHLPQAAFQLVEYAGHAVNQDAPQRLAERLNDFYRPRFLL